MSTASMNRRTFVAAAAGAMATAAATAATALADQAATEATADATAEAAADTAAADVPAWLGTAPVVSDSDCVETVECEVLVIGAGSSGYFAACAAAENGAKTLLIEKNTQGNNIRSSAIGSVNSRQQQEKGAFIETVDIVNDMDHYALGQIDSGLVKIRAENSGEAVNWYEDILNSNGMEVQLEYNMPEGTRYAEWPTGHGTNGDYPDREAKVAETMDAYIRGFDGCDVRFETALVELIMDGNTCKGVYATNADGVYIRINASAGVVVATGGYAMNQEMYKALQYQTYSGLTCFDAFPSCQGDGIKALLWAGAKMDSVHTSLVFNRGLLRNDQQIGDPYNHFGDYGYFFFSSQPFLRVNHAGQRFHNESAPYDFVMHAIGKQPEGLRYWHQIWDSNWIEDVTRFHTTGCSTLVYREGADHDAVPNNLEENVAAEIEAFVEQGFIQKADTLEELAQKLEITDVDVFLATCEAQNTNFDNQHDPDFGKEAFRLSALRTAPFYGTKCGGLTLATLDGIIANHDCQPFGADGTPMEGVYVIGNDQGGFYAGTYPNLAAGLNAGRCATFGRLVGKALAAKATGK